MRRRVGQCQGSQLQGGEFGLCLAAGVTNPPPPVQHQAEYEEILAGVKGADNCKRLSSQFIARFFGLFPDLTEQSIDSMLDLCEDNNVDIRKQVRHNNKS